MSRRYNISYEQSDDDSGDYADYSTISVGRFQLTRNGNTMNHVDLDAILLGGDETREVNPYYGIYKINMLVAGGSGSGKTTFILDNLFNKIIEADAIFLFAPFETITSGLYKKLINASTESADDDDAPDRAASYKPRRQAMFDDEILFESRKDKRRDKPKLPFKIIAFDISKKNTVITGAGEHNGQFTYFEGMPTLSDLFIIKRELKISKPLLIFDDFVNILDNKRWGEYYRYIHNGSRLNAAMISCVQSINKIPPQVRSSYTIVALFPHYLAKTVCQSLLTNTVVNSQLTKDNIKDLLSMVRTVNKPHTPLIVIGSGKDERESIMFDNIYINMSGD
jgi:hypothetical protein